MSKRIITDNIDLSNKSGFSKDDFYGAGKETRISSDSQVSARAYSGDKKFYALLSTSDKEINNRLYDYESWKKTVTDGVWQGKPYQKPFLRNHDLYYSTPSGRVIDSFFIDHETLEVTNKDNSKLPEDVVSFYKDNESFINGTGSVIVELTCDETTAQRIESGLDVTVSQSSFMNDANCNICGKDYYGGECEHSAGREYAIEKDGATNNIKCLVVTKDYDPVELSIVNIPANDTSLIYVHDAKCKPKKKAKKDELETEGKKLEKDAKFDDNVNKVENVKDYAEGETSDETLTKTEDAMWKQLAKNHFADKLKAKFKDNENLIVAFDQLFETVSDEQANLFKTFIDQLAEEELAKDEAEVVEEAKTVEENETEEVKEENVEPEVEAEETKDEVVETETEEETVETEETKEETPEAVEEEKVEDMKSKALENVFTKDTKTAPKKYEDKTLTALVANLKF